MVDLIGLRDGKVVSLEMFQQDTAAVLDFLAHHEGNDPG